MTIPPGPAQTPSTGIAQIAVIAPNLKRRLSGVTATIARLVPVQARMIGIAATGPGLPPTLPHLPLWRCLVLPRHRWRVWHARRNTEMLCGLALRHLFRRRLKLLFTSASQRRHTGYTRWLIARMDRVVATSPQAASYLQVPATVVTHGVDTATFHPAPDRAALRREMGLPPGVLVGCFGRIRAQKGVDVLVAAALDLLPARPDVTILLTGRVTDDNRAFHDALTAQIAAAGLADRVRFLGELPWAEVVRLYQALDLFVAPARWEGFGLTPIEAMACGVPVVATRVGAFEAILADGAAGTLVPPGDAVALAAALAPYLDDAALRRRAGAAALERVRREFRIEDEAAKLVAIYRDMLAVPE